MAVIRIHNAEGGGGCLGFFCFLFFANSKTSQAVSRNISSVCLILLPLTYKLYACIRQRNRLAKRESLDV